MEGTRSNESGRSGAKAAYIVKKYRLGRMQYGEKEFFVLPVGHDDFEKIIGRGQPEVFTDANIPPEIPLGESAADAVIALYGLTNSALYGNSLFKLYLGSLPTEAENLAALLRASAYEKYDTKHEQSYSDSIPIERVLAFQRIRPCDIVDEYRYLRG